MELKYRVGSDTMKVINILGAFTVLICNLVVSYNHSIELFQAGGFSGWMAHVAVIGAETTFILGALNLVVARLRGVSPGTPAILGGLLGVALVSWSNVAAGWSFGWPGILLGLATPASLIVAEAILSREALHRRRVGENRETSPAPTSAGEQESLPPSPAPVEETNREEVVGERRRESASRENPVTPANSPTINKAGEQHRNNTTHSPAQVGEANREKAGEKRRETVATPANSPATTSPTSPAPAPTNPGEPKREKESADTTPPAPADLSHLVEVAREIMEREGRPPGRRRLAEMTGASEWECRRALAALRKGA